MAYRPMDPKKFKEFAISHSKKSKNEVNACYVQDFTNLIETLKTEEK